MTMVSAYAASWRARTRASLHKKKQYDEGNQTPRGQRIKEGVSHKMNELAIRQKARLHKIVRDFKCANLDYKTQVCNTMVLHQNLTTVQAAQQKLKENSAVIVSEQAEIRLMLRE